MIYLFYFFAALLVFLSYKSFRGGIAYLDFFKRELARPAPNYVPFASIIAPCRGLDAGLEENLEALFRQIYPQYEVIFVVDSETDEAVETIETVSRRRMSVDAQGETVAAAKLVVAGKASGESQKVHNLRAAVRRVSERSEVFVFVDSDARPSPNWLRDLIAPLADAGVGAATGYRWFVSKKFNFASELRAVWNASIASALGAAEKKNFCWGGSMALRRSTFEKTNMRERWRGTLSDDFAVTRAMRAENLPVRFVPQALTASVEDCSWRELFEFTTRQMKITRVYAPDLWMQALIGAVIFNLVWIWGALILFFHPANSFAFWFALLALALVSVFSTGKAWLRLIAVRLVLKDYERDLRRQFATQNTLWIFSPALFFYNSLRALVSRKILWRGIRYELVSPIETRIIDAGLADRTRAEK